MDYYTHHTGNYIVEQISDTVGVLRNSDNVTIGQIPIEIVEDSMDWEQEGKSPYSEALVDIIKQTYQ